MNCRVGQSQNTCHSYYSSGNENADVVASNTNQKQTQQVSSENTESDRGEGSRGCQGMRDGNSHRGFSRFNIENTGDHKGRTRTHSNDGDDCGGKRSHRHHGHHGHRGRHASDDSGTKTPSETSGTPTPGTTTPVSTDPGVAVGEPVPTTSDNASFKPSKLGNTNMDKEAAAKMDRWDDFIAAAAKSTGLPANYIKATMYAESRGNEATHSYNPDGVHEDLGLMQISDYTYGLVRNEQSGAPKITDISDPAQNIMAGAWELKDKFENAGGSFPITGNVDSILAKTSAAYVGHGDSTDAQYAKAVLEMKADLDSGRALKDEYGNF